MKKLSLGLLCANLFICQSTYAGFLPENNLNIPVDHKNLTGISEKDFNSVIDQVEETYAPIVSGYGGELKIIRKWDDGTVNAYAEREEKLWKVSLFGGLARHKSLTRDGFALVACHELGHHIGGAPQYQGDDWASNEGQADYFATLKCLRRLWQSEDNELALQNIEVPKFLTDKCKTHWPEKIDQDICIRGAMAGDSVAKLFADLSWSTDLPQFDTPDEEQVEVTDDGHPANQCRLDTYFQGALCEKTFNEEIGQDDEVAGACHASTGHVIGLRPRCWFKPSL